PKAEPSKASGAKKSTARTAEPEPEEEASAAPEPEPEEEPKPPPEPKWIRELGTTDRRKARDLIERLTALGIDDAEDVARGEVARREPALAREALERQLHAAIKSARTPRAAA